MSANYWDDEEREEGVIERVDPLHQGWYSVTSSNGWTCGVSAEYGVEPKVGDRFITWGAFGRPIRGQAINNQVLYYRSPAEQDTEDAKQREEHAAARITEYESKRAEYDTRVEALPAPLRERIEGFRANNPSWRWEYEPYELACCEEAARLSARFQTGDALKAFSKLDYHAQRVAYPEMSSDHSGNTWGMSLRLAYLLVQLPELVAKEHAAICPLMGCASAGCYAGRQAEAV